MVTFFARGQSSGTVAVAPPVQLHPLSFWVVRLWLLGVCVGLLPRALPPVGPVDELAILANVVLVVLHDPTELRQAVVAT